MKPYAEMSTTEVYEWLRAVATRGYATLPGGAGLILAMAPVAGEPLGGQVVSNLGGIRTAVTLSVMAAMVAELPDSPHFAFDAPPPAPPADPARILGRSRSHDRMTCPHCGVLAYAWGVYGGTRNLQGLMEEGVLRGYLLTDDDQGVLNHLCRKRRGDR